MSKPKITLPAIDLISGGLLILFFIFSLDEFFGAKLLPQFFFYDTQRILELLLLIGTLIISLVSVTQTRKISAVITELPTSMKIALSIILGVGIISSIMAPLFKMALLEIALFFLLMGFALTVAAQRKAIGTRLDIYLIGLIILITAGYGIYFLCYLNQVNAENPLAIIFPGFINIRFFSEFQLGILSLLAIPISAHLRKIRWATIFLWLLLAFWWALAMIAGSKSVWISCGMALMTLLIVYRKRSVPFVVVQTVAIIFGFLISFLLIQTHLMYAKNADIQNSAVKNFLAGNATPVDITLGSRLNMAKQAFHLMKQHPIVGVGPMHYAYYPNPYAANPHDALLLIASEWGLPVDLLLIFLVVQGSRAWVKKTFLAREDVFQENMCIGLSSAMIAITFNALTSSALLTPVSQIMIAIIFGWALGFYQAKFSTNIVQPANVIHGILVFGFMSSIIFIIIIVYPQLHSLTQHEIIWYLAQSNHQFNPRFWLQGWIYQ